MQTKHKQTIIQLWLMFGLCLLSSYSQALGLGEPVLKSKLGEPLRMEIALINVGDLSSEQLLVGSADRQQYAKFEIGYQSIHSALRYRINKRGKQLFVEVTSRNPVKEPYIDILLSLKWPDGELLKTVTVLLDAP